MLLQETRFQPLPQHSGVHGDMRQQLGVADAIKASFDVPFQNPLGTMSVAHQAMNLIKRIGTTAFQSKAIGMAVGL